MKKECHESTTDGFLIMCFRKEKFISDNVMIDGDFQISLIPNGDIRAWANVKIDNQIVAKMQFDYRFNMMFKQVLRLEVKLPKISENYDRLTNQPINSPTNQPIWVGPSD